MPTFTLDGVSHEYAQPKPDAGPDATHSWEYGHWPRVEAQVLELSGLFIPIITAVIIGAWYAFWRWLEPRLPDWLTRAVLGSAKAPTYEGKHEA